MHAQPQHPHAVPRGTSCALFGSVPSQGQELRDRTRRFALDIVRLVGRLPRGMAADAVARQLVRAGTGIAANHRAAGRARSRREFTARLAVALEEADEAEYWLSVLRDGQLAPLALVDPCYREAQELRAILMASVRTARASVS
jgi:four helix bundle protein